MWLVDAHRYFQGMVLPSTGEVLSEHGLWPGIIFLSTLYCCYCLCRDIDLWSASLLLDHAWKRSWQAGKYNKPPEFVHHNLLSPFVITSCLWIWCWCSHVDVYFPSVLHQLVWLQAFGLCFTRWKADPTPLSTPVLVPEPENTGNSSGRGQDKESGWRKTFRYLNQSYLWLLNCPGPIIPLKIKQIPLICSKAGDFVCTLQYITFAEFLFFFHWGTFSVLPRKIILTGMVLYWSKLARAIDYSNVWHRTCNIYCRLRPVTYLVIACIIIILMPKLYWITSWHEKKSCTFIECLLYLSFKLLTLRQLLHE